MSAIITRPQGLSVVEWANNVSFDLSAFGAFGSLVNPEQWQNWGAQLLNNATLGNNLPDPYAFTDWQRWAERLCDSLS